MYYKTDCSTLLATLNQFTYFSCLRKGKLSKLIKYLTHYLAAIIEIEVGRIRKKYVF